MTWRGAPLAAKPHSLASLGIGRTLQSVGLFAGLSVAENVMAGATHAARTGFASSLFALPRADREERRLYAAALDHLDRLGIADYAGALPGSLPFAVQKRVALARALIAEPALLLLDEPAAGLGADEVAEFATVIRDLPAHSDGECSVMLVEHHVDLVMRVCDTVVVLDFGRVIASGDPATVRASAAVTKAYLGSMSATAADAEQGKLEVDVGALDADAGAADPVPDRPDPPDRRIRRIGWIRRIGSGGRPMSDALLRGRRPGRRVRRCAGAARHRPASAGRHDHGRPRRERSRQDDPAAHSVRLVAAAQRADRLRRSGHRRLPRRADRPGRSRARTRERRRHHRVDGAREPAPRRTVARGPAGHGGGDRRGLRALPGDRRAPQGARRGSCPAASGRCLRSVGHWWPDRACCCWTSRRSASPPASPRRS